MLQLLALIFVQITIGHHLCLFVLQLASLLVDLCLFVSGYAGTGLTVGSSVPLIVPVLGFPVVVLIPVVFGHPFAVVPVAIAPIVIVGPVISGPRPGIVAQHLTIIAFSINILRQLIQLLVDNSLLRGA